MTNITPIPIKDPERCPRCGSSSFAVARDMKATRHCKCGTSWEPEKVVRNRVEFDAIWLTMQLTSDGVHFDQIFPGTFPLEAKNFVGRNTRVTIEELI